METVTAALVAVSEAVFDSLPPTATLPKARVAGDTESCALDDPSPESGTEILESPLSLVTVSVPVADPDADGEKMTFSVTLCPAATVAGRLGIVPRLNPPPLMPICDTVKVLVPLAGLLTTRETVFLPPTATLPKSMELEDTVRAVEPRAALGAGARAHPANRAVVRHINPSK